MRGTNSAGEREEPLEHGQLLQQPRTQGGQGAEIKPWVRGCWNSWPCLEHSVYCLTAEFFFKQRT